MKILSKLSLVVGFILLMSTILVSCRSANTGGYGAKKVERRN